MTPPPPGRVIILNGVGGVGKSSIARALQDLSPEVWLHVQMDAFLDMLPARYTNHPEGLRFIRHDTSPPEVEIVCGPAVDHLLEGMRASVSALARAGNNVIVDEVLVDEDGSAYREALAGLDVLWVGIMAPLDVIEARERQRGDRDIGLARWQYPRVHRNIHYDLTVDAARSTPAENAGQILGRLGP